ncbi:glycosyltransferase family 39 protein [Leptothoe sp. PORK10 BA2]|uniref:glycosyltransferase family 39 protein n=1 Tax=Leptothoe sp. PORK10 BA2 TaxID=3110254 RepID=UPI002B1F523D|nr:glycosyltransferase family 39 protein [Leptothoe sp. PORK10 BA2]MEA5463376.1 glycosyltransferase family 39 protein [Leptothoe sp. PORK10 BA2]
MLPPPNATSPMGTPPKPFASMRLEWILLAAVAIAGFIRMLYIGVRELWYDEVLSLLLSTTLRTGYVDPPDTPIALASYGALLQLPPFSGVTDFIAAIKPLLQGLVGREPHPPLFFLSQYLWLLLTGNQEISLRSLNLLLSLGAILGAYGMGKALFHHRGGLLLAALLGLNPFFWFHSLNMRMYCPTVLWVTLGGWAVLQLCYQRPSRPMRLLWYLLLTLAITGGILTYYLSALWFFALGGVILIKDRKHWWHYGLLALGAAGLAAPWFYWGLPQQLRNVDLKRFATDKSFLETIPHHIQGVLEVLGIQLLVGDWATSLPPGIVLAIGALVFLGLAAIIWHLGCLLRQESPALLVTVLVLACLPLLLMLAYDIFSGKSTLAWGFGRSAVFILPGLLLLVTAWVMNLSITWQKPMVLAILLLYLGLNMADMAGRNRQMFHQIAAASAASDSTLIAMNSKAWGHVLRLVYYLPQDTPVKLLATNPTMLPKALETLLSDPSESYDQVLWLEAERPVWKAPTESEAKTIRDDVERLLTAQYGSVEQRQLVGTMDLDRFRLGIYQKGA